MIVAGAEGLRVMEGLVALTGIEGVNGQFSSVLLDLSRCICVQLRLRKLPKRGYTFPTLSRSCHSQTKNVAVNERVVRSLPASEMPVKGDLYAGFF